jgi:dihydroorotase
MLPAPNTMLRIEGKIVNHDGEVDGAIEINPDTGLIESVGAVEGRSDIDTAGCLIFPGFGDLHVHSREDAGGTQNYKEDFLTMSEAAIHGGVVQVADMPNNPVTPIDDEKYEAKKQLAKKSLVNVTLYAGIGPNTEPLKIRVPYKAFMGPSVGDLFFSTQEQLEQVIAKYEGQNVSFHCEDPVILEDNKNAATHEAQRPPSAEITATDFALHLIEKYNLVGKLCHYSTKEGLPKIKAAKARGLAVTVEVTPHHLFFDDSQLTEANHKWLQMNPPLRSPEDRLALIEALRSGDIDYLATDHAPHTIEEKEKGTSGVPHLDTYAGFACWLMAEHNFTLQDIARVCSHHPGNFVNEFLPSELGKGFGVIAPGYAGSLTIIDPNKPLAVTRGIIKSKAGWSPFEGMTLPGQAKFTIIRGKVYHD